MPTTIDITMPGRVYEDYLDPLASGMQEALGLPEPTSRKVGRGSQFRYADVPVGTALELAEYLHDRADMLIGQDEDSGVHYSAMRVAERLREQAR